MRIKSCVNLCYEILCKQVRSITWQRRHDNYDETNQCSWCAVFAWMHNFSISLPWRILIFFSCCLRGNARKMDHDGGFLIFYSLPLLVSSLSVARSWVAMTKWVPSNMIAGPVKSLLFAASLLFYPHSIEETFTWAWTPAKTLTVMGMSTYTTCTWRSSSFSMRIAFCSTTSLSSTVSGVTMTRIARFTCSSGLHYTSCPSCRCKSFANVADICSWYIEALCGRSVRHPRYKKCDEVYALLTCNVTTLGSLRPSSGMRWVWM